MTCKETGTRPEASYVNTLNSGSLATPMTLQYGNWGDPEATRHSRRLAQDQRPSLATMEARTTRERAWFTASHQMDKRDM